MELIVYLLVLAFWGLVVGGLARLALPGRDPMSIPMTMAVGVAGMWIAGIIWVALFDERGFAPFLLGVACTAVIVYVIRRSRGGGLMSPGRPPLDR